MKYLLISLAILLAGDAAFGTPVPKRAVLFKGKSTAILDTLIKKGITNVKGMDLNKIRASIPIITWKALRPGETVPDEVGHRTTAFYTVANKTVTVMSEQGIFSDLLVSVIALHESLGALGYDDRNYQLSLPLYCISQTKNDNDVDRKERQYEMQNFIKVAAAGGTGVGGGGDFLGLVLKSQTLLWLWRRPYLLPEHYQEFFLIDFEADYTPGAAMHRISFDANGGLVLNIPAALWISKDPDGRLQIAEMADLLVEGIFLKDVPKFEKQATITCPQSAAPLTFSWPKPIPNLKTGLEYYFRGANCTVEDVK